MRLEGKVALITGGAHGMGEAEAKLFAREGAKVAIGDVLEDDAGRVRAEIESAGGTAIVVKLDVTSETDWEAAMTSVRSAFGQLDILVNNAGINGPRNSDLLSTEHWDRLMNVNARGGFLGVKFAIPEMLEGGGGSIVNISSISGFIGQEFLHPGYNASKGAVRILTKSLAVQYARRGIRVNSVHPGVMPPMMGPASGDLEARKQMIETHVPMGREGLREEVANGVLFLASDDASYITGTELVIDGGYLAA